MVASTESDLVMPIVVIIHNNIFIIYIKTSTFYFSRSITMWTSGKAFVVVLVLFGHADISFGQR